ncbi:MAG: tetratricopeptide repeat protein [Candidatus Acidiferrales bacterium]
MTQTELQIRVTQLLEQNEHREAAQLLSDAIADQGESCTLWNDWAVAQCAAGRFEDAERAFRRALQVDPAYAPAIENLGTLLCSLGKKTEALPYLLQTRDWASGAQREHLEKLAAMCAAEEISKRSAGGGNG